MCQHFEELFSFFRYLSTLCILKNTDFPRGLVVGIRRSHRCCPGSIPGVGMIV